MSSHEIQDELWGRAPRDWADLQENLAAPLWQSMLAACGVSTGTLLLDAGCGAGGASVLARTHGAVVTGLDASDGLLDVARQRVPEGDFRVGDLENLPFADATFDTIIAASSIQFAHDPLRAVRELVRVAKPDSRISVGLFSTPDKVEYRAVLEAIAAALSDPDASMRPFALSHSGVLEDLLETAGLAVMLSEDVACPFVFQDMDTYLRGVISAGPVQAALDVLGEPCLRRILEEAAAPYQLPDGRIRFEVAFHHVTGAPSPTR